MATYSKQFLSASSYGTLINVTATTSPGTTVHTAVAGTSNMDEVWLYACNVNSVDAPITVEFGGTTTGDRIDVSIPTKNGLVLVVPGWPICNSQVIKCYTTVSGVHVGGFVNRIVP